MSKQLDAVLSSRGAEAKGQGPLEDIVSYWEISASAADRQPSQPTHGTNMNSTLQYAGSQGDIVNMFASRPPHLCSTAQGSSTLMSMRVMMSPRPT